MALEDGVGRCRWKTASEDVVGGRRWKMSLEDVVGRCRRYRETCSPGLCIH
jgi:hypothetical protein